MNLQKPSNANYCATIVKLQTMVPLAKCDNVQGAIIYGQQVIVGKNQQPGDVGVYFPVETALSREFLGANNLFRKPEWGNLDQGSKGYFEEHGRIRCVKFRGHKSEGFWIPLAALAYTGVALEELLPGMEFDTIGDHQICQKYVRKMNPTRLAHNRAAAPKVQDRILPRQFAFHPDTENLRRNIYKVQPSDYVSISDKWHGTSAIFGWVAATRPLSLWERLAKRLGLAISDRQYEFVWASRRVVKGLSAPKAEAVHYYGEDLWGHVGEKVKDLIPLGYAVYGEIVGWTPSGSPIQGGYHYGCPAGTHRLLVYRVTTTNHDGVMLELTWPQVLTFCRQHGFEHVHVFYQGYIDDWGGSVLAALSETNVETWQGELLKLLEQRFIKDAPCPYNNNEVPAEGIVLRCEHADGTMEAFKLKNFAFLEHETKALDAGTTDLESEEESTGASNGTN